MTASPPRLLIVAGCISLLLKMEAAANPIGGQVTAGSASFEGGASALTIRQSSDRGIIHWQDFSISKGESVKFLQPGASSAILNRVTGGKRSDLLGALRANGNVYLINPNGILIGAGSVIDTNGFIASTLDVSDEQFMAGGDLKFMGDSTASVTNLGKITARGGDVFLIANTVENAGTIDAPNGTAGLAAGQEVLLKSAGDERILIAPTSKSSSVHNSGTITGATAELKASGNLYALAINNTGTIRATGLVNRNGRVILSASGGEVRNAGTISAKNANGSGGYVKMDSGRGGKTVNAGTIDASGKAKGAKGGRAEVVGDYVELAAGSLVDVSGDAGGGVALIGGDKQGKNPAIQNAKTTKVAQGAVINADAISSGDGGTAIVWADDSTEFAGTITARGGAASGNGGFAEVSGKEALSFTGMVDLSAVDGNFGTLLLDPKNTRVANGGTATPGDAGSFGTNPGTDAVIAPGTLRDLLANILIQTNNDFTLQDALDLTSTTGGTPTPNKSFTVQAGKTIQIEAALTTANGAVNMTANATTAAGVDVTHRDAGTAAIVFQSTGSLTTNGGDVNLTIDTGAGLTDSSSQDISFAFSTINAGAGDVTLINRGPGQAGNPGDVLGYIAGNVIADKLTIETAGEILFYNPTNDVNTLVLSNAGKVEYVDADDLIVGENTGFSFNGSLQLGKGDVNIKTTTGDLTINAPGFLLTTTTNPTGFFTLDAAGKLTVNQGVTKLLNQVGVDVTYKAGGDVAINADEVQARNLTVDAGGKIAFNMPTVSGKFGVVAGDANPHGKVTLTAANGDITATTTSTITARDLSMTATTGLIDLDGVVNAQLLKASALGDIRVDRPTDNSIGALGAISSGANISLTDTALGLQIAGLVQSTAVNGIITIKATGGSTVQFIPSANCRIEVTPGGVINFESTAQILDGTTPSFIGGSLAVIGRAIGGGTTNPLNTQVSRLEAKAAASGGFGGFAFVTNNEAAPGTLAIGGVSANLGGFIGDGKNSGGASIVLINHGSIELDTLNAGPVFPDVVFATNGNFDAGSVSLTALGATSDIVIGAAVLGAGVYSNSDVTLNSDRDIILGTAALPTAGVVGGGNVQITATGSVRINGNSNVFAQSGHSVDVSADQSIFFTTLGGESGSEVRTEGGTISLFALLGTIDVNTGSTTPAVSIGGVSNGKAIFINAPDVTLGRGLATDAAGFINLSPVGAAVPIRVGDNLAGSFGLTDAELDRIRTGTLTIGDAFHTAGIMVTADISRPAAPTYDTLILDTQGNLAIDHGLDMVTGNLEAYSLGNITSGGDVRGQSLKFDTLNGHIDLDGDVFTNFLTVHAPQGNIFLEGSNNNIETLAFARYLQEFRLRDTANGLKTTGFVDGSPDSFGFISVTGGALTLGAGTEVIFGSNNPFGYTRSFKLHSDTAFINQAGAGAIVTEFGARYLIYVPDNGATQLQLGGLTPTFALAGVSFPTEPANTGNGVLVAAANPALPLSTSLGTPAGGSATPAGGQQITLTPEQQKALAASVNSLAKSLGSSINKTTTEFAGLTKSIEKGLAKAVEENRLAAATAAAKEQERRQATWPPVGSLRLTKEEVRRIMEKEWTDGVAMNKYLYWDVSNMSDEGKADAISRLGRTDSLADRRALSIIVLQEYYMPFSSRQAAEQFMEDYGYNAPEFRPNHKLSATQSLVTEHDGKYFVWLPAELRTRKPSQPAPPPSPIVVKQPPKTTITVTTVSTEVNPNWPPPK